MSSNFDNLALDLANQLTDLVTQGKIRPPFEVTFFGTNERFLGSFQSGTAGENALTEQDVRIAEAVFPLVITVTDSSGAISEIIWAPPID
jgi:hypothetical protein